MITKLKFINHSSFQILKDSNNLLIDPWYYGKVFNNTWSLLREGHENLEKGINYIFISHEHPDHLSFSTLKYLKDNNFLKDECTVIFPYRKENSVKNAIEKLGLKYFGIKYGKKNKLELDKIQIAYYGEDEMGDHTMVFDCEDLIIINQNDHYTPLNICKEIVDDWKKFDVMFTQFSLAGYYGNKNDTNVLKSGKLFHIKRVEDYTNIFNPKFLIPYASFVYFCDEYNSYLNDYIVDLDNIVNLNFRETSIQIVNYGDDISFDKEHILKKNKLNLNLWKILIEQKKLKIFKSEYVSLEEIIKKISEHMEKANFLFWILFRLIKKKLRGNLITSDDIVVKKNFLNKFFKNKYFKILSSFGVNKNNFLIKLSDYDNTAIIIDTLFFKKPMLIKNFNLNDVDLIIPSRQLLFALNFPWGPDTLNITATGQFFSGLPDVFFKLVENNNKRK